MLKVALCQRIYYALFGIMSISAHLKRFGHQVELVMEESVDRAVSELLKINPQVVGISTQVGTGDFEWALAVAEKLKVKRPDVIVILGGYHPTVLPSETMEHACIDFACVGEGELPMQALCNALANGRLPTAIPGTAERCDGKITINPKGNLVTKLDEFAWPDRELYDKYGFFDGAQTIDVLAGRGCPYRCHFCFNTFLADYYKEGGDFVRKHSVDYIVEQMLVLKQKYQPKLFRFMDELFLVKDLEWHREFAEKYSQQVGVPFICNVTADVVNEESASILAKAGAYGVCFGLESGNENLRMKVLQKRVKDDHFLEAGRLLKKHGIHFLTSNMVGLPGETVDDAFSTIELNQRIGTDYVWQSVFQPYPKLKITNKLEKGGELPEIATSDFDTTYFKGSKLEQENIHQLVNLHKLFVFAFHFPFLRPIIRKLIRLPSNPFFEMAFMLGYAWTQIRFFKVSWTKVAQLGFKNLIGFYRKARPELL